MGLKGAVVKDIVSLGTASFLLQVAACISTTVVNMQLVKYGALSPLGAQNAMAAIGVVNRLAAIAVMPIIGVSIAAQPLLGFNYGAGFIARVKKTVGFAILYAVIIGTALWLVTHIWPTQIVSLFGVSDELMDLTVYALKVQILFIPIVGLQVVTSNYFQATGQPLKSIVLSLTRQILFLLPALFFMPELAPALFSGMDGLNGLFLSWPFADFLSIFTSTGFLLWEFRRLARIQRGEVKDKFTGQGK